MSRPRRARVSFTCPKCGSTSYHPQDVLEGYCGSCHDWTGRAARDNDVSTLCDQGNHGWCRGCACGCHEQPETPEAIAS